ncbi:MAG: hypothetical protein HY787_20035 [Deltaproteobacteria bacterium]|nr:hypothetical protein [Deltaproteobacteria bacterium]
MYLLKQVKVEKDAVLVGKPKPEDLTNLRQQGYLKVLDIMPMALKDKRLAGRVRSAGLSYQHIPVETCDLESCHIEDEWVVRFFQYLVRHGQEPMIINTDDEILGISLVLLSGLFLEGKPYQEVIRSLEALGVSLRGRKDIKRFIREFYAHYKGKLIA